MLADAATLGRALDGVALELAPVALYAGFAGVAAIFKRLIGQLLAVAPDMGLAPEWREAAE